MRAVVWAARHDQTGAEAGEPAFPFALVLQPSPLLAARVERFLAEGVDSLEAVERVREPRSNS